MVEENNESAAAFFHFACNLPAIEIRDVNFRFHVSLFGLVSNPLIIFIFLTKPSE